VQGLHDGHVGLPLFSLLQKLLQRFGSCEWHVCKARTNWREEDQLINNKAAGCEGKREREIVNCYLCFSSVVAGGN
jgi:hypothetical protein